jgi:uncharacterized protein YcbX
MATLARIGLTPLKGTALHHPTAVRLTEAGIAANRRFHLVDERGALFTSEGHGPLVRVVATFDPAAETLRLELPDGRVIGDRADGLGGPVVTDFYGRPVAGRLVDGPFAAALSAYIGRPVRLVRTDREGDGSDVHRLTLISSASVRELGTRSGRPDLGGCAPFEEDAWAGRQVRVGAAVVMVLGPVPRCVVTTRDPTSGLKDFDTLKRIAEFRPLMTDPRGVPFGMYAEVVRPGLVRVGDDVGPLLG